MFGHVRVRHCVRGKVRPVFYVERSQREGAVQPKVSAACTNRERNRAIRLGPSLTDNVPDRQVVPRQCDRRLTRLAWLEFNVGETFQERGRLLCRCGVVHIQLRDLKESIRLSDLTNGQRRLTSVPATEPAFATSNVTWNAGM